MATHRRRRRLGAHQVDCVAGSEGEDVGAGHRRPARRLHPGFDGVDDLVSAEGVRVAHGVLLADHRRRVIQKDGCIAALRSNNKKKNGLRLHGQSQLRVKIDGEEDPIEGWQYIWYINIM